MDKREASYALSKPYTLMWVITKLLSLFTFNRSVHNLTEDKKDLLLTRNKCQLTCDISVRVGTEQFTLNLNFLFYQASWFSYKEFQKTRQEAVENFVAS